MRSPNATVIVIACKLSVQMHSEYAFPSPVKQCAIAARQHGPQRAGAARERVADSDQRLAASNDLRPGNGRFQ